MRKLRIIILSCIALYIHTAAQGQAMSPEAQIAQVHGDYTIKLSADQRNWQLNCLSRCEVVAGTAPELAGLSIPNLSTVGLNNKFVSTLTIDTTYNIASFNPLKYQIDFFKEVDQYFKIGSSAYVLKVHKKP